MRLSILQFKRSLNYSFIIIGTLTLAISLGSCEVVEPQAVIDRFLGKSAIVYLNQEETEFLLADRDGCPDYPSQITFDFSSPYGHHKGKLATAEGSTILHLEKMTFNLGSWQLFTAEESNSLCQQFATGEESIKLSNNNDVSKRFLSKLGEVAPNCHFQFTNFGLSCELPLMNQSSAHRKIKELEKKLFRTRQRHPYSLAHRLAMARKLVEAQEKNDASAMSRLCQLASLSQEIELPLPMRSQTWLENCDHHSQGEFKKFLAASIHEAITELDYLLSAFQRTRTGVLTLRIPRDQIKYRDLWVKLRPKEFSLEEVTGGSCFWHPNYPDSEHRLVLSQVDKSVKPKTSYCNGEAQGAVTSVLQDYLSHSICSETEFPISNGRGKILALPPGTYEYELRVNHAPFAAPLVEPKPSRLSEGELTWKNRRPYPVISKI